MINLPEWADWAFSVGFLVMLAVVFWMMTRGERVGSIDCPWFNSFASVPGNVRVVVRRQGAAKTGQPTVQVVVSAPGMMHGFSFTPYEAGVLADMLDEAAHQADPR
jgi:hypothetical protein